MVTGGAGFIGVNFVRYWRSAHPADTIFIVDSLTYAGNKESLIGVLNEQCKLLVLDINQTDAIADLLRKESIDTVVHFAAESHVDRSIEGPDAFINANILGTYSLLKAARQIWQQEGEVIDHHFHHVSTDEVYGSLGMADAPFTEVTPYAPNSPYSASKASADFLVRSYHHTYGLNVTTSNCSNNYGPYHFPEKLIPLIITNAMRGADLPVYGDGKNVRDWLYVEDHARGIECVLKGGQFGESYNIGGCNEWTNIDIVKIVCRVLDNRFANSQKLVNDFPLCPAAQAKPSESLIRYVTDRAGHDFRYAIDNKRIHDELGFTPEISFEAGIEKTIDWYLANITWWQRVLDGSYRDSVSTQ